MRREKRVARLQEQEAINYWRNVRDFQPPQVDSPRLDAVQLRSTSVMAKTCVGAAKVSSMQHKNVWCPIAFDDSRDFLSVRLMSDRRFFIRRGWRWEVRGLARTSTRHFSWFQCEPEVCEPFFCFHSLVITC